MQRNVGTVCTREVVVAQESESVLELARLMRHHHVGDVVIVQRRGEKSYPSGIVTDRDIVIDALVSSPDNIQQLLASDLIGRPIITVREQQTLDDALEVMRENGVRRAPVVDDDGALVGILAADDLVELFADRLSKLAILFSYEQRIERGVRP
jgi:CBS domain-containing protein